MNPFIRADGVITNISTDGVITIKAKYEDVGTILSRNYKNVIVEFVDKRQITPQQRKMVWALIGEISDWMGEQKTQTMKSMVNEAMKLDFIVGELDEDPEKSFSLSTAPISVVCAYQKFLIDFILENGISTKKPLVSYADDVIAYLYSCVMHKRCAVCGAHAEIHHIDRVGMGRDRKDIIHVGMEALPLCRAHHTEAHSMPDKEFFDKYHFAGGIALDKTMCLRYNLKTGGE